MKRSPSDPWCSVLFYFSSVGKPVYCYTASTGAAPPVSDHLSFEPKKFQRKTNPNSC
jgi:hypothetical protein